MPHELSDLQSKLNLRYQDKSCRNCRYFRVTHQSPPNDTMTGDCLLLGRMMSISGDRLQILEWSWNIVCDGWSKVPKNWKIDVYKNPFFYDPYIKRRSQKRLRNKVYARLNS